ncbi:hypothetical protein ABID99_000317 [Mucilaginibacter sp. OAE612]|uniref:DUF2683 family protein n=1 Tax=Mucilaginibacter sp. OAE612 TaxID=3156444 RepID=UPI00359D9D66
MKKAIVLEVLQSFGDEIDIEKLIERLLASDNESAYNVDFVTKIKESREQVRNGDTNSINIDDL